MAVPTPFPRACAPAALACALCVSAHAASAPPSCHRHPEKSPEEVLTLEAMIQCQDRILRGLMDDYVRRRGRSMSADAVSEIQDFQREEMSGFLRVHPDRTLIDEERRLDPESEAKLREAENDPQGLIGMLATWFGGLMGQMSAFFHQAKGGPVPPENPEGAKAVELTQKAVRQRAKEAGTLRSDGTHDTAATLGYSIKKHNQEVDQNLDPSMQRFFTKPGDKKKE